MRLIPLACTLALLVLPASAQRHRCGTPEPLPINPGFEVVPSDCGYFTNSPEEEYEPTFFYNIPVVFHVIQNNAGVGFLDAATIQDQIDILNEDFQAIAGSPGAPGTNGKIRFHLATTDPNGQPTTGITYSNNNNWFQDNGNYWTALAWDTNRYMNIYTNAVPCCYGYVSGFPSEGIAGQSSDRIVVWWEAVGRNPTSGWPLNMGRTSTHEVGHYLGLYHTFCGGCGSASNCYGTGDLICDTNREADATFGCPAFKNSCGSTDPIHNYMDYTDDPCLWEFTPEQVNRMRCTLVHWRPLLDPTERIGTPYCDPAVPNSTGSPAWIAAIGSTAVADNELALEACDLPLNRFGYFITSKDQALIMNPGGSDGTLCLGSPLGRFASLIQSSGTDGVMRIDVDLTAIPLLGAVMVGETFNFQCWYRDVNPTNTSNFSNTVSILFQ